MDVNDRIEALSNIIRELVRSMDPRSMPAHQRYNILHDLDRIQQSIEIERSRQNG